jgi:hypothetical protein
MTVPGAPRFLDERFFEHRRKSTTVAGIAGGTFAGGLFLYRHFVDGVWNWDLFGVLIIIASVKMCMMLWYRLTQ